MSDLKLLAATTIMVLSSEVVWPQSVIPQPYELTSRGVIASDGTERYKTALENCYRGRPGDAPKGPEFLACLKRQVRVQGETLNGIVRSTLEYLKKSPDRASRFQGSQRN